METWWLLMLNETGRLGSVSRQNCKLVDQTALRNMFWFSHCGESCISKREKNNTTLWSSNLTLDCGAELFLKTWYWQPGNVLVLFHTGCSGHTLQNVFFIHNTFQLFKLKISWGPPCNLSKNTSIGEKVMTRLFPVACKHTVQGVCVLDSASPQFNSDLCALWYIIRSHVLTKLSPCQCNCRVFLEVRCHGVYRAAVAVAANMTLWDYGNCWMENILKHNHRYNFDCRANEKSSY